jgi:hypothetical protein
MEYSNRPRKTLLSTRTLRRAHFSCTMFIPNSNAVNEAAAIKAECSRDEQLQLKLVPEDMLRPACQISVTEVQCGDPQCAPIDTALTIVFDRYALVSLSCAAFVRHWCLLMLDSLISCISLFIISYIYIYTCCHIAFMLPQPLAAAADEGCWEFPCQARK